MDKWCRLLSCTRQFVSYSPRINAAFFQFRVRTRFIRRRMFTRGRFFILVHNVKLFFFLITKEYVKLWSKSYEVNLQDHCSTSSPTCLPRERKRSQRARVQLPLCTGNSCLRVKTTALWKPSCHYRLSKVNVWFLLKSHCREIYRQTCNRSVACLHFFKVTSP